MMDVKGPEIRTGDLSEPIYLQHGQLFDFLMAVPEGDARLDGVGCVKVNYPNLINDVSPGDTVLVDNRRHINLPGVQVGLPSLTEKDLGDIGVGLEEGVDLFALSFVRDAEALHSLRSILAKHKSKARIIAKVEGRSASDQQYR